MKKSVIFLFLLLFVVFGCATGEKNVSVGDDAEWIKLKINPYAGIKVKHKNEKILFEVKAHQLANMYVISSYPKGAEFPVYPGSTLKTDNPYRRGWHQYVYTIPDGVTFETVYEWYMDRLKLK